MSEQCERLTYDYTDELEYKTHEGCNCPSCDNKEESDDADQE